MVTFGQRKRKTKRKNARARRDCRGEKELRYCHAIAQRIAIAGVGKVCFREMVYVAEFGMSHLLFSFLFFSSFFFFFPFSVFFFSPCLEG